MIRKRIKKRRNPSMEEEFRERRLTGYENLKHSMSSALKDGNPTDFVRCMVLYKRGRYCYDCDMRYYTCRCDDCEECGFVECLCPLNLKYKGNNPEDYTDNERKLIKKEAYGYLLKILNDDLYTDGKKYNLIPNGNVFKKIKEDFLKNVLNKSKINLSEANLNKADLSGADLAEADLSRADLAEADLSRADLSGANLSKADLMVANLYKADLSGANLSEALLNLADLSGADLSGADLTGADLYRANFTGALIKNTNFDKDLDINKTIGLEINNPRKTSMKKRKYGNTK